ncbi:MAG: alpha/beta hydrolase [Planctomycetes bacterium]|nr:alpha/beta hydrolase [Planctomycetota bacterium]
MSFNEVLALKAAPPTARIAYGDGPQQFGELRIPEGKGPHPVVVLIHGGCWLAEVADLTYFSPMAETLTKRGVATWNIEYRRIGNEGGGWPGTFLDVGRATDHLRVIAKQYALDLDRVVVAGHSAGGHLALWIAARKKLDKASELFVKDPLPVAGVVNLSGPGDLATFGSDPKHACGEDTIRRLLGGGPKDVPSRYRDASPTMLLPLGVPQVCISGLRDQAVPFGHGKAHTEAARKAGDDARFVELPEAGHFEVIAPTSDSWRSVEQELVLLALRTKPEKP